MALSDVIAAAMQDLSPSTPPVPAAPPPPPNPALSYRPPAGTTEFARRRVELLQKNKSDAGHVRLIPSERAPEIAEHVRAVVGLAEAVDAEIIAMTLPARQAAVAAQLASKSEPKSDLAAAVDEDIAAMRRGNRNLEYVK